jgi:hypothetical protein
MSERDYDNDELEIPKWKCRFCSKEASKCECDYKKLNKKKYEH